MAWTTRRRSESQKQWDLPNLPLDSVDHPPVNELGRIGRGETPVCIMILIDFISVKAHNRNGEERLWYLALHSVRLPQPRKQERNTNGTL